MRRFGVYILLFISLLTSSHKVLAQTPPPATEEQPPIINLDETPILETKTREQLMLGATPAPPSEGKLRPIWKGMTSVAKTGFGVGESFLIKIGTKVGFSLQDIVKPWYNDTEKEIAAPNLLPHAKLNETMAPYLLSQQAQDNLIHYSAENTNILTSRFCAIQVNKPGRYDKIREDIESTGNQESSNVDYSQTLFENARLINAAIGLQYIEPTTNKKYDMNLASEIMGSGSVMGFCDWSFNGFAHLPVENVVRRFSTFGDGSGHEGVIFNVFETIILYFEQICEEVGRCHDEPVYDEDTAELGTRLTEVSHDSNFHQLGNIGNVDLNDIQSWKAMKKAPYDWTRMLTTTRGWAFNFLPEIQATIKKKQAATTDYAYSVFGLEPDGGNAFKNKLGEITHPWPFLDNASQREKEAGCIASPDVLQSNLAFGTKEDNIAIGDACPAPSPMMCKVDTYQEILNKLPKAIDATCSKHQSDLPISKEQCAGMMNEIFNIEIRNDPAWSGENYRCDHRADSTAAGPFQIIDETYNLVSSCSQEHMDADLEGCKTKDTQLSRCVTEDAAELAMRVILHFSTCDKTGSIGSTAELYTAVCNYGTGDQQLPWLNGQTYCEDVFKAAGIPIP